MMLMEGNNFGVSALEYPKMESQPYQEIIFWSLIKPKPFTSEIAENLEEAISKSKVWPWRWVGKSMYWVKQQESMTDLNSETVGDIALTWKLKSPQITKEEEREDKKHTYDRKSSKISQQIRQVAGKRHQEKNYARQA